MNLSKRQLVRIASDIRDRLQVLKTMQQRQIRLQCATLAEHMERLKTIQQKLQICETRSWPAATADVAGRIEAALRDVPYYAEEIERAVKEYNCKIPSVKDIYEELIQTEREFGNLQYHREGKLLAVTTEPIELDDVYLGEFEIQLHVPGLVETRRSVTYRIIALDPHPAASNEGVTHPHVSDEGLCPGDAGAAITTALASGRICDFFTLVRAVLTNYNPDSPYVSLDKWSGVVCYDCGYVTGGDVYWCNCCEHDFCEECVSYCRRCEESMCRGCLENCSVCEEPVCQGCITECPDCGRHLCRNCLDEQQCLCIEENQENEENENDSNGNATTETVATSDTNDGNLNVIGEAARATARAVGIDAA